VDKRLWLVEVVEEEDSSCDEGKEDGEVICEEIVRYSEPHHGFYI